MGDARRARTDKADLIFASWRLHRRPIHCPRPAREGPRMAWRRLTSRRWTMRALLCVGMILVATTFLTADEEKVPLDKVPKAVIEAVKKRFPRAELVGASTEKTGDKTVY